MKILLASYGGGHVRSLIPIAKELEKKGYEINFFAFTTAFHELKGYDFKVYRVMDFLDLFDENLIIQLGKKYFNGEKSHLVSYKESISYYGIGMFDLINKHGKENAEKLFSKKGRFSFCPVKSVTKILEFLNPDLLITTNSPRYEKAIVMAAREKNIYSIIINDLFAVDEYKWLSKNDYGNKICVINKYVKDFLIKKGRKSDSILITGNPNFQKKMLLKTSIDKKMKNKFLYKIKKNQKVVLWVSQPVPEINNLNGLKGDKNLPKKILKELLKISKKRDDLFFINRLHPNESLLNFQEYKNFVKSKTKNVYDDLSVADIVIVINSSVGYQAFLENKKIIQIQNSNLSDSSPYSKMGIATPLFNLDSFEDRIDHVLCKKNLERADLRQKNLNPSKEISNLIEKLSF
ncbi:MAG: hypothetical protein ACJ0BF_04590 [Gammaproteobacteria bacterium]|tara:strand:- start:967 stop:2181 length:1215 start_codon:yes stop_codon:yes gene_type:complete